MTLKELVNTLTYDDELELIKKLRMTFTPQEQREIMIISSQEMTLDEAKVFLKLSA